MFKSRIQILLASLAILSAAAAADAMTPRTLMAQSSASLDLETLIPKQFEQWKPVPDVRVVEPPGSDVLSREIYNQEIARGFVDDEGHVVMLLVAYGVSQSDRLQLHRPEICYRSNGFRVSQPFGTTLSFLPGHPPIRLTRLVAQREGRLEPVTYWMRIGNDVATGVVERQILKVKYGLRGLIPDGALIRVSTVGLPEEAAFALQDRFIRDLLKSVDPQGLAFLTGDPAKALNFGI
jgi:EpsI family protein